MTNNKQHKHKESSDVVVAANNTAVAVADNQDYSAYAGQGFEDLTKDDYAVPFMGVLQALSPLLETKAEARAGMLVNTVTKEVYDGKTGVSFIPVERQHSVIEWKPNRGGFVAAHPLDSELVKTVKSEQEFGKWKTIKGDINSNDLTETFSLYGIFVSPQGTPEQMIISFSGTKIKKYKSLMTKARTVQVATPDGRFVNPPLFAHKYRITTIQEKNAKGTFFNFNIEFDGGNAEKARIATNDPLFKAAVAFRDLLKEGTIKAAYESTVEVGAEPEEAEIPFA